MKFILTPELGRLAKWLRILGFDAVYSSQVRFSSLLVDALRDNRVILTRNAHFINKARMTRSIHVKSDQTEQQLKQVFKELHIKPDKEMMFINGALDAFTNLDFFDDNELRSDFNTAFDNNSFPVVVDVLFKYNEGQDAFNVIKSIIKVTKEYMENKLDKESEDYFKTIDFLKTINSSYRQKISSNLSPKSFEQNVF